MNNGILKFKKQLDKSNAEKARWEKADMHQRAYGTYEFYHFYLASEMSSCWTRSHTEQLIKLDEEDIAYFVNKYFPKLQDEMNQQMNKIKEEYESK